MRGAVGAVWMSSIGFLGPETTSTGPHCFSALQHLSFPVCLRIRVRFPHLLLPKDSADKNNINSKTVFVEYLPCTRLRWYDFIHKNPMRQAPHLAPCYM